MTLELSALAQERLEAVAGLMNAGDSSTVTVPAGRTVTRAAVSGVHGGVDFSCQSMYDCTVTITNSVGTITATWESMMLPGGDAPMVMASAFAPTDTFAQLNAGSTAAIRALVNDDPGGTPARAAPNPTSPTRRGFCRFSFFSVTQVIELLESDARNRPQGCL